MLSETDLRQTDQSEVALRILHTADWHLGMRFPSMDEVDQVKLSRARLEVIDDILAEAEAWDVAAILCAGDLFDEPSPDKQWWEGLLTALEKRDFSNRPVFLLPGNHDPLTPNSVYHPSHAFRGRLPKGVHVVDRSDFVYEISEEAVLFSSPCTSQAGDKDLALGLPVREEADTRIRIGMVHGQTHHFEGYETSFPIAKDAAARRGFDYIALGDTHSFLEVEDSPMAYPGTPEQSRFGEETPSHAILVSFKRRTRKPRIQLQRVGRWRWREERCEDLGSLRSIRESPDLGKTVMRLILDMTVSLSEREKVETILSELKGTPAVHGRVGVLMVDQSSLRVDTRDGGAFPPDLPESLGKVISRLQEDKSAETEEALCLLYRLIRDAN
ncbi:MAG: DNA repair exonuclease [Planctomycetota bacterium]|nr:DNA repair exonuclease [Planctomycetota bacterium]MDP7249830.1 DNA repair exonuclease [Planctomycetota bacterium]